MIRIEDFTDITYEVVDHVAVITINRPDRYNALRGRTVDELIYAFRYAWVDTNVGAIILTGAGDKAFCSGGDQKERAATGGYGETEMGMFEIERLHRLIREVPKPVIAAVNGFAIGGGHVLHVLCDVSLASSTARFGQVGPRVGSFDAGFGTAYLARVVGEKRAREIWFFCDQYDAATAERWGLVNRVVPHDRLMDEAMETAGQIADQAPHALRMAKALLRQGRDANFDQMLEMTAAMQALAHLTEDHAEGVAAVLEKRPATFTGR